MPGLAGYWPSRSVTFIDNHDTGKDCPATLAAVSVWLLAICCLPTKMCRAGLECECADWI